MSETKEKRQVAFGILGMMKDSGLGNKRWRKWRPSVGLCLQEGLNIERFELIVQKGLEELGRKVSGDLQRLRPELEVNTHYVDWHDPWDLQETYASLHELSRQIKFNPEKEELLVHITTGTHIAQICMYLLVESGHLPGLLVQTAPPEKFRVLKEGELPEGEELPRIRRIQTGTHVLIDLDLARYDKIAARFEIDASNRRSFLKDGINTRNAAFNSMIEEIELVAERSSDPMLLLGPTGAGKSSLARRIFQLRKQSRKLKGEFVEVNCATLRGDAAMSVLFGHKKGAFTGAGDDREGLLKAADGGLLFLDEVGELPLDSQAILLHALEEKVFYPLGSDKSIESDFQIICGTNRDLGAEVREGKFRGDLLARINLWTFDLPGLKKRPEDIEPNIEFEVEKLSKKLGLPVRFNKEALSNYLKFAASAKASWSGNFRDLNASLTRLGTLAGKSRIDNKLIESEQNRLQQQWRMDSDDESQRFPLCLRALGETMTDKDEFELLQLEGVLAACLECESLAAAGRRLFAHSRQQRKSSNDSDRLRKFLLGHELSWKEVKALGLS